jgi:hypothetical protein
VHAPERRCVIGNEGSGDERQRRLKRFRSVDHEQQSLLDVHAPVDRVRRSVQSSVAFPVLPFQSPSGVFTPSVVIPSATTWVRSAISIPSSIITARRTCSRSGSTLVAPRGPRRRRTAGRWCSSRRLLTARSSGAGPSLRARAIASVARSAYEAGTDAARHVDLGDAGPMCTSAAQPDAAAGWATDGCGFIWRSGCQRVEVIGHRAAGKPQGLECVVPGCRGDAAASMFATGGQPHIRGLGLAIDPKTLVRRTVRQSEIERGPTAWGCSQATLRPGCAQVRRRRAVPAAGNGLSMPLWPWPRPRASAGAHNERCRALTNGKDSAVFGESWRMPLGLSSCLS